MVQCTLKIPLNLWRLEDDIWDYMTIKSWFSCRGRECNVARTFLDSIKEKLNGISYRRNSTYNIWDAHTSRTDSHLVIVLYTSDKDISTSKFMVDVQEKVMPILTNLKVGDKRVLYNAYEQTQNLEVSIESSINDSKFGIVA